MKVKHEKGVFMYRHPRKIAFAARKGGGGKSTSSISFAGEMAMLGSKVLIMIFDQQDDLADSYLIDTDYDPENYRSLASVLKGEISVREAIYTTVPFQRKGRAADLKSKFGSAERDYTIDIMPAGYDIPTVALELSEEENLIANIMKEVESNYDYIIMDLPPSDANESMLALEYANYVIVPAGETASFKSVNMMVNTVNDFTVNGYDLDLLGIIINRYSKNRVVRRENENTFRDVLGPLIFSQTIRDSTDIEKANAYGLPLSAYPKCDVGMDWIRLSREIVKRIDEKEK